MRPQLHRVVYSKRTMPLTAYVAQSRSSSEKSRSCAGRPGLGNVRRGPRASDRAVASEVLGVFESERASARAKERKPPGAKNSASTCAWTPWPVLRRRPRMERTNRQGAEGAKFAPPSQNSWQPRRLAVHALSSAQPPVEFLETPSMIHGRRHRPPPARKNAAWPTRSLVSSRSRDEMILKRGVRCRPR